MPDYWQFSNRFNGFRSNYEIYQAHVMRYLSARNLIDRGTRKVWVFCGDGEMDDRIKGAIGLAGRRKYQSNFCGEL